MRIRTYKYVSILSIIIISFFRYVCLLLQAFVPPCGGNSLNFESHVQNTIARFDGISNKLKRFLIRDLDGVEVHHHTFKTTCGLESGYIATVESLETLYSSCNYSMFQTHLQHLIQVLGLNQCASGWQIVYTHFLHWSPVVIPCIIFLWIKRMCQFIVLFTYKNRTKTLSCRCKLYSSIMFLVCFTYVIRLKSFNEVFLLFCNHSTMFTDQNPIFY